MPPATPHMDKLQAGTKAELASPLPLHAVIWAPRADNKKVFNPWLKDALVKQGMYTQVSNVNGEQLQTFYIQLRVKCDELSLYVKSHFSYTSNRLMVEID